jgi:hypothetical protein
MLRIRVKLCRGSACVEVLAIANSGFVGAEPEVLVPPRVSEALFGPSPQVELVERVLADGSRALLPRALEAVEVYAVEEDRMVGPVKARAYIGGRFALLNDKLLGRLGIVIIDAGEGLWCFRDELGLRTRRGH